MEKRDQRKVTTFGVTGMTCASCVVHVEHALREVPGVTGVNVNLATERATVAYEGDEVKTDDLVFAVEDAGYGLVETKDDETTEEIHEREYKKLKMNLLVAAGLTALILLGSVPHMFGIMLPIPQLVRDPAMRTLQLEVSGAGPPKDLGCRGIYRDVPTLCEVIFVPIYALPNSL